ncbi:MAG: hydrogenase maturation protease [Thermoleophilaceae bacterium]
MNGYWEELERPGPDSVEIDGLQLRTGSRVLLRPRAGGDIFDLALDGRAAVIEGIDQDLDGQVKLAVVVEEDPGADLGRARQPGHRFFFGLDEVEPAPDSPAGREPAGRKVLVAGIGNVFLGDDGFGVALAGRLARRELPPGVDVVDYGIRGIDLAYAMPDYETVVLLDAAPRGDPPGTLYVIEPQLEGEAVTVDAHGMDPVNVLGLVRALGGRLPRTLVVGCEPATHVSPDDDELVADLSEPVRLALDEAVRLVESLLSELEPDSREEASHR